MVITISSQSLEVWAEAHPPINSISPACAINVFMYISACDPLLAAERYHTRGRYSRAVRAFVRRSLLRVRPSLLSIFLVPGSGICDTRSSSLRRSSSAPRQGHGAMMFWLHRSRDRALVGDLDFRKADEQTRKRRPACRFMVFRSGCGPGLR